MDETTTIHCQLQQAVLPPPPFERVMRDMPLGNETFPLLPTVVMICRRCWHVELHSMGVSEDKETAKLHRLVVNPSPSPCTKAEESDAAKS